MLKTTFGRYAQRPVHGRPPLFRGRYKFARFAVTSSIGVKMAFTLRFSVATSTRPLRLHLLFCSLVRQPSFPVWDSYGKRVYCLVLNIAVVRPINSYRSFIDCRRPVCSRQVRDNQLRVALPTLPYFASTCAVERSSLHDTTVHMLAPVFQIQQLHTYSSPAQDIGQGGSSVGDPRFPPDLILYYCIIELPTYCSCGIPNNTCS
ncbi:unnamed protein product [Macrosiphum euphorbiae]|uniref:Uncharacterized protein n=2 Tax=Macrosiphum euphorbiae TaxID=13131 RepID=A0AAV0VQ69_9HEMI|nr:unnamed protein product [Macrosiphum euphorbiae]CAI6347694.1 unnamed protein product [Macrosiphum euphorbiae]